ncbi:hypothetical protein BX600DRAFT_434304 [Xylariales sp. PMI_506]|nr:hypothetical protein BX600DRAFT_434304 [Xylariales sp. PMI_506]
MDKARHTESEQDEQSGRKYANSWSLACMQVAFGCGMRPGLYQNFAATLQCLGDISQNVSCRADCQKPPGAARRPYASNAQAPERTLNNNRIQLEETLVPV